MTLYRFITVPINEEGIKEADRWVDTSPNLESYNIPDEEYKKLWKNHIFDVINSRFDLMIDHDESEMITAEQLKKVIKIIETVPGVFADAAKSAIKHGTRLYLDF